VSGLAGGSGKPVRSSATTGAAATGGRGLAAITARSLPDMRCRITPGRAGATIAETARCTPRKAGAPPIDRVELTRFTTKGAMDKAFVDARALSSDPTTRRRGACRADRPWGGHGRWFKDPRRTVAGGRMFCSTEAPGGSVSGPRIAWTVNTPVVMAEAYAARSADLGRWWPGVRSLG
jgi:hypothetical protein